MSKRQNWISSNMVIFILLTTLVTTVATETIINQASCPDQIRYLTRMIEDMNKTVQATAEKLKAYEDSQNESIMKAQSIMVKGQHPELAVSFFAMVTQEITLQDQQTIIFDKVITNLASGYDAQRGQFTAPVDGLYFFSATLMAYPSHYIHAELVHNGKNLAFLFAAKGAYAFEDDTGTAIANVVLQQGDTVWVRHMTDPSGIARMEEWHTTFSGYLISEAIS